MHSIVPKIAALGVCCSALLAYKDGPPPNRAGGFGDGTCAVCHTGGPLNAPGGSLKVDGVPERYAPGAAYRLVITLRRPDLYVGGFQMIARAKDGTSAGTWRALDDRAKAVESAIQQTLRGSRVPMDGENRWEVEWTAPDPAAGDVVLNIAANASNDDASALGDSIYTAELTSRGP